MTVKRKSRSLIAFTLIELLVVVALISILAALLLPSLKKARDISYRAGCINNLRQVYIGINLYADDNNGAIHLRCYTSSQGGAYGDWSFWNAMAEPTEQNWLFSEPLTRPGYIKDKKIFYCPSQPSSYSVSRQAYAYVAHTWANGWNNVYTAHYDNWSAPAGPKGTQIDGSGRIKSLRDATERDALVFEFCSTGGNMIYPTNIHGIAGTKPKALHVLWGDGGVTGCTGDMLYDGGPYWLPSQFFFR